MRTAKLPLLLAGLGIEIAFLYLLSVGDLRAQVPRFWIGIFPAFLFYLTACVWILRRPSGSVRLILLFALLFRLTFWWSPPTLSDDIYRYVWDGRVQLAGINPYLHPPEGEQLAPLRDPLYAKINHREIPTVYPPLAQLFFRFVCSLIPGIGLMKFDLILCEFGLALLLVSILRQRHQDPRRVLFYAWNPLTIVEVAGSGHLDPLGILLMMAALYLLGANRFRTAVVALAGAFLSKLLPVLLLPLFWRHLGPSSTRRDWLAFRPRRPMLWFPVLVLLGFLPFSGAGLRLFAGLQTYLLNWHFNDLAFSPLRILYGHLFLAADPQALARSTCTLLLLPILLWSTLRLADPYRTAFWIAGAYLLLSPTLHPWYLLWILPFLPLFPQPAWILLSGLIFLAYNVLIEYSKSGLWIEHAWVKWAQFGPFFFVLFAHIIYQRRRSHPVL